MINQERIKNLLLELVQIDSHSRKERDVAERIKKYCEEMGAQVEIDDAGEKVGGNSGNVIARFPGTIPGAESIMMSAHMDTVVPGEGVKPIVEGDIIRTDGTTVLGGDDNPAAPSSSKSSAACRSRTFRTRRSKRSFRSAKRSDCSARRTLTCRR